MDVLGVYNSAVNVLGTIGIIIVIIAIIYVVKLKNKEKQNNEYHANHDQGNVYKKIKTVKCPFCNKDVYQNDTFCMYCGKSIINNADNRGIEGIVQKTKLEEKVILKPGKCPVCGNHTEDSDSICSQCGFPVISIAGNMNKKETDKIIKAVKEYKKKKAYEIDSFHKK